MIYGNIKKELIDLKNQLQTNYVSIFPNGRTFSDDGKDVLGRKEEELNGFLSNIDGFLSNSVERFARDGIDFDSVKFDFLVGLIYPEDSLGEDKEIIPTSSPIKDKARYYTGDIYAYQNGKEVSMYDLSESMGYQGYIKLDKLVRQFQRSGFDVTGITSFEELEEAVLNQTGARLTVEFNFNKELENNKEEKVVEKPKSKVKSFLGL